MSITKESAVENARLPVGNSVKGMVVGAALLAACTSTIDDPTFDVGVGTAGRDPGAAPSGMYADGAGGAGPPPASAAGASQLGGGSGMESSSGGSASAVAPPPFEPALGMLRRLTRAQFRNAVRDVLGVDVDTSLLDADNWKGNFAVVGAGVVTTTERGVEQYAAAIEAAVDAVFVDPTKREAFVGCTPNASADDACVRGFIEKVGRRAFRRALDTVEVERLVKLAKGAATELGSGVEGLRWATIALFTSPSFLYRPELGTAAGAARSSHYTGYEMASRLSFLIWNSLPDDTLLDEAEAGKLATPAGIRAAAERLLDARAGREAASAFAEEFMRLDRVGTQAKDSALFPEYGAALQAAMVRDMREVWAQIVFDDQASVLDVFSTRRVVANAELARLYGLDADGLDSNTFRALTLPVDSARIGILGKAAFLSQFANQKEGSATLRGKFLRESLTCTPVPPPPPNVSVVLQDPPADQPRTKRQRLEMHRSNAVCAGCHSLMDPLGLPFETFDAIGREQTTDHGLPIDSSGEFLGNAVADSRELGLILSQSPEVAHCLVHKYYAYALGHEERDVDASVIAALSSSFQASGYRLRSLILELVSHEAFSTVAIPL